MLHGKYANLLKLSPVQGLHFQGLYLHNGELADRPHGFFGALNPPPNVKDAYARIERYQASDADYDTVRFFVMCHSACFEICMLENWNA